MDNSPSTTAGAQSLRRALKLLRLLAEHHEDGIRLPEVMAASGLERSTAHRLLSCLVEERFAERDATGRRRVVEIVEPTGVAGSAVEARTVYRVDAAA